MPSQEQSQEQTRGESRESRSGPFTRRPGLPGVWPAALIAAISGALFGLWVRNDDTRVAEAGPPTATVSDVAPDEIEAALGTVSGTPEQLDRFRARDACGRHLAWVTVMRAPGQQPGHIRLQSGGYFSPLFELADTPVRVALPYPAPYPTGHGTLTVVGTTADAIVALTPPWHVPAQPVAHRIEVKWKPSAECAAR